ncbi:hypothetical protein [Aquifex sp.]
MNQEALRIIKEPVVVFFIWFALLYIIASVFLPKRFSFWVSSLSATYFWLKYGMDKLELLKAWGVIFLVLFIYYCGKVLSTTSPFLFLTGRKICPLCCMIIPRKAKVCPHCGCEPKVS